MKNCSTLPASAFMDLIFYTFAEHQGFIGLVEIP